MNDCTLKPVRDGWQVICPDGSIANDHTHKDREKAERHRDLINAFEFWRRDEDQVE